jgi:lipoprotein-anchoring transpeptidase ErfK/SrfK
MRRLLIHLGGLYAIAVVMFCTAGVMHDRPDWADATRAALNEARDTVVAWTSDAAGRVDETVTAWLAESEQAPPLRGTQTEERRVAQPAPAAKPAPAPRPAPAQTQTQVAEAPAAPPPAAQAAPETRDTQVAEADREQARNARSRISPNLVTRVRERLRASLSDDLYNNFELFLYVSKADHGPWSQQMFVFAKGDGALRLLHHWPVSTGRERDEPDAHGRVRDTDTPAGYYQLDPGRMIRKYRSVQWDAPMPYSMFFNWIRQGSLTGLAIHGVEGDELALLGTRASAGCVRLSPESAQTLFDLIQKDYRGQAPRFAMGARRYSTMSNRGELARDKDGNLVFARGFRVLVYIDSYGGAELVSALY